MARTKEFDADVALGAALDLFWERGYEATSMTDLVDHLGIGRQSIYDTFGSKRELYLRALDRYSESVDPDLLRTPSRPGPALPAVRGLVDQYLQDATGAARQRGCFVVNTAVELAAHDPLAHRRVQASWNHLEASLTAALTRAQEQGELSASNDPRASARFLVVLLQGLRVIGRSDDDPGRARDAVTYALAALG